MSLVPNTYIILDAHSPKKDRVITVYDPEGEDDPPVVADTEVGIFLPANTPLGRTQWVVGVLRTLLAHALTVIKDAPEVVSVNLNNSGQPQIDVDGTPDPDDDLVLLIGGDIAGKAQSHFLDRTGKRLMEVFLEETKNQVPVVEEE